jgi:serine phosphatase RsbU (regulator of sigma subunit)
MEIKIAVSKIRKYASRTSGDTVEVTERPNGGVSVVMADGQSSGRGAKWVSSFVVRKVISLLADGVRDGAAARAASDALFTERGGKVSATLNLLSADLQTNTLVITRNNPSPVLIAQDDEIKLLDEPSKPIGLYQGTRPIITQLDLQVGMTVVLFTDGITHAGRRIGQPLDAVECVQVMLEDGEPTAQEIADSLLEYALKLEQGRPSDDTSVVVLRVMPDEENLIRRMTIELPVRP